MQAHGPPRGVLLIPKTILEFDSSKLYGHVESSTTAGDKSFPGRGVRYLKSQEIFVYFSFLQQNNHIFLTRTKTVIMCKSIALEIVKWK